MQQYICCSPKFSDYHNSHPVNFMLNLLVKTRFRYYRNYIKYHFDKITLIEIGLIFFFFLLLLARSPADIGYRIGWLLSSEFSASWLKFFINLLPFFYLLSELSGWRTLRHSGEWNLLVTLPFKRNLISSYFFLRHISKTASISIVAVAAFLAGADPIIQRMMRTVFAVLFLLLLQQLSFLQARNLRDKSFKKVFNILRWMTGDILVLGVLIFGIHKSQKRFRFLEII